VHDHSALENPDRAARRAMRLSVVAGLIMLVGKCAAWWSTGSYAILSDAFESVIHVVAVGFAAFSFWLARRPANEEYHYGYERVSFFSAGFEGALIIVAAIGIIVTAIQAWVGGIHLAKLGAGTAVVAALGALNGALGWYLIHTGRRVHSLILIANGKHVLSDCWTSLGVVFGLLLVIVTGWKPLDPVCAILVGLNILWSGGRLVWESARGLLDYAEPETTRKLSLILDSFAAANGIGWHDLRFRETGGRLLVEVHLLFPYEMSLGRAHEIATSLEVKTEASFDRPVEVTTHLEAHEDHSTVHHGSRRA
jgi:cation diffusion facilitator family transporter